MDDYKNKASANSLPPEEAFWLEVDDLALSLSAQLDYFEMLGAEALPAELFAPSPVAAVPRTQPPASAPKNTKINKTESIRNHSSQAGKHLSSVTNQPSSWALETNSLEDLAACVRQCPACTLSQSRPEKPFMGQGGTTPLLVVVGPTPGIFKGEKATLLTAILEKGLELSPTEYFSTSLVKCESTSDQPPPKGSDDSCWPILKRQLTLLAPKVILVLGKKTAQQITGLHNEPFGLIRPRTHKLEGLEALIRVTYGLEDMMADQEIKKAAWQDLLKVKSGLQKIKKARA